MNIDVQLGKSFYWMYHSQILRFLSTLTIKSDAMAIAYNELYKSKLSIDPNNPLTFPYYQNLAGMYHSLNIPMNTGNEFPEVYDLTKEVISENPFILDFYYENYSALKRLYNRYPDQITLIQGILFNTQYDINYIIALPNYSILGGVVNILDEQERDIIMLELHNFLQYFDYRWYINTFHYEELYSVACDSVLWSILPLVLLYFKIQHIKTSYADNFHIWEYLTSKGLEDFRSFFNHQQTMFFYKNIDYLIANKGKINTIDIINDTILKPLGLNLYSLYNRHELKSTDTNPTSWDNTLLYREHDNYNQDFLGDISDFKSFQSTLYKDGLDPNLPTDKYVKYTKDEFKYSPFDTHITKFQKVKITSKMDDKYFKYYLLYILDNLVYLVNQNKISFYVQLNDVMSNKKMVYVSIKEIIPIIYYIVYKSNGITPTNLPTTHHRRFAFTVPNRGVITSVAKESVTFNGITLPINELIDIGDLQQKVNILVRGKITSVDSFSNYLMTNYTEVLVPLLKVQRGGYERIVSLAANKMFLRYHDPRMVDISNLFEEDTYEEWFDNRFDIKKFINVCDHQSSQYGNFIYQNLLIQIFENISKLEASIRMKFYNTFEEKEYYRKLINLVESFSSYLVRLLKSDLMTYNYFFSSFKYLNLGFGKTTISSYLIYPSKGTIFKQ